MISAELKEFHSEEFENIELPAEQVTSRQQAAIIQRDYVCSVCWQNLQRRPIDKLEDAIYCPHYAEHRGFVTKYYAERRRAESAAEIVDVNYTLRSLGVIENPHAGKTAQQLLSELGF